MKGMREGKKIGKGGVGSNGAKVEKFGPNDGKRPKGFFKKCDGLKKGTAW